MRERRQLVEDVTLGRDLGQIAAALQKHKVPATLCPACLHIPDNPPLPSPSSLLYLLQALEAELRCHQAVCTDLKQRGRDLGAHELLDPQERAEVVQYMWQQLRARAALQGTWLQAALLVQQVVESMSCWQRSRVYRVGQHPACPSPHSTSQTQRRWPRGYRSSGWHWRACPAGRTRQAPRPCCWTICGWSAHCAPSGQSCSGWMSRPGQLLRGHHSRCVGGAGVGRGAGKGPRATGLQYQRYVWSVLCISHGHSEVEMGGHLWPLTPGDRGLPLGLGQEVCVWGGVPPSSAAFHLLPQPRVSGVLSALTYGNHPSIVRLCSLCLPVFNNQIPPGM